MALYALMTALAIHTLVTNTANSEFSGMGLILVTLPWSLLWSRALEALGLMAWYDRFAGSPALYGLLASLTLFPAALPYAFALYFLGSRLKPKK